VAATDHHLQIASALTLQPLLLILKLFYHAFASSASFQEQTLSGGHYSSTLLHGALISSADSF
jgi:hypothetical protein